MLKKTGLILLWVWLGSQGTVVLGGQNFPPPALGLSPALAATLPTPEAMGKLQQLVPARGFMVVDGERYFFSPRLLVFDEKRQRVGLEALAVGMTVLLSASGGEVFAVFIQPAN